MLRIGFYICHCGINIAHKVRVEEVADFVRTMPYVAVSRDYKFMCSDPGQEMIEKDIHEFGLNRVVVASCSPPAARKKPFRRPAAGPVSTRFLFQMASVREQVSWVTTDEDEATLKAKTLAAAAISRVCGHQRLQLREVGVHPEILVVGGGHRRHAGGAGTSAIRAARSIWWSARPPSADTCLQFDKTFPTLDCAACIGTPKMVEVAQNPNIQLHAYTEVESVSGFTGNFQVTLRKKTPGMWMPPNARDAGSAPRSAPVEIPSEWDEKPGHEKGCFFAPFPRRWPITFCIDKKDRAPLRGRVSGPRQCPGVCPAHQGRAQ